MSGIIIAIDGYSSTGKSTLAKSLAKRLGYTYIDSGAMYRAVSLYALNNKFINSGVINVKQLIQNLNRIKLSFIKKGEKLETEICLNGRSVENEIRKMNVSNCVSLVSEIPEVRKLLVAQQRLIGEKKSLVMDGRDIGSIVFPEAELKLFMTASEEIRAQRRYLELKSAGLSITLEEIKVNLKNRDYIDMNRISSPLIQVQDALVLDNTNMDQIEQLDWVLDKISKIKNQ